MPNQRTNTAAPMLPAKPRDLQALARAGQRLWRTRSTRAVIWSIAEVVESKATEPVRACGTAYTCALEAAWQEVDRVRRRVFNIDQTSPGPAATFLCSLILDGPANALGRTDASGVCDDWPQMVGEFRDAFAHFDAQELATLLRVELNRVIDAAYDEADDLRRAYRAATDDLEAAARFHELVLRTAHDDPLGRPRAGRLGGTSQPEADADQGSDQELEPVEKALALMVSDRTMTVTEIAKRLRIRRQRLYEDPRFRDARRVLREVGSANRKRMRKGKKDIHGNLEAWDE